MSEKIPTFPPIGQRFPRSNEAFRKLWASQRFRKLGFRYGYPDVAGNVHMMITAPVAP